MQKKKKKKREELSPLLLLLVVEELLLLLLIRFGISLSLFCSEFVDRKSEGQRKLVFFIYLAALPTARKGRKEGNETEGGAFV